MSPATSPAPAERLARIIDLLCRAVAARSAGGRLAGPLIILIWSQLRRRAARILRLADRIDAGAPPAPSRPRAARPRRPSSPPHLSPRLPRGRAWLVRLVPEAAAGASQLRHLLAQPETAKLLADPRMGRLLRPLCHMLGVAPPPDLAPNLAPGLTPGLAAQAPGAGLAPSQSVTPRAVPAAAPVPRASKPPRPARPPRPAPAACGPPVAA